MFRSSALLAASFLLGSCSLLPEKPEIQDCEKSLLSDLRSPSTYKRVSAREWDDPSNKPPRYKAVVIEYDAANAFGTPVRERKSCFYPVRDGRVITDAVIDQSTAATDAMRGTGAFNTAAPLPDLNQQAEDALAEVNRIERSSH